MENKNVEKLLADLKEGYLERRKLEIEVSHLVNAAFDAYKNDSDNEELQAAAWEIYDVWERRRWDCCTISLLLADILTGRIKEGWLMYNLKSREFIIDELMSRYKRLRGGTRIIADLQQISLLFFDYVSGVRE